VSVLVLALLGAGWFYLAPTRIGGSNSYVVTHGISMEPLIHAGDLVVVRSEPNYRVGQVVAYHSKLLNTVVLHRIIRIEHGHYYFKGDNNSFVDPTAPTKALLVGSMWLHIAGGGVYFNLLHQPWVAALLLAAVGAFLIYGGGRKRRRRDRGRRQGGGGGSARRARSVTSLDPHSVSQPSDHHLFEACVVGAIVCAVLCVVAFMLPASNTVTVSQRYTQTLRFSYRASVPPGPVYPSGTVATGDPVYLQLVHQLTVTSAYRLTTRARYRLHGSIGMRGTLTNTTGWSRSFTLAPPTPFTGASARSTARINLSRFQALANRIFTQIGGGGSYSLTVTPEVKIAGQLAGQRVSAAYSPTLNLSLGSPQLLGGISAIAPSGSTGSSAQTGLVQRATGTATTIHSSTNTLAGVPVEVVRWLSLVLLALCAWGAWRFHEHERENPPEPAERIGSRYKHLIVPVEPFTADPEHPPIEVSSIEALAQLAERSERLILHDHQEDVDNYLIDDQGTLYRFSAPRTKAADENGTVREAGASGAGASGDGASGDRADHGLGDESGEAVVSDPAAEEAAAILSSAAAKLSAAAAQATAAPPGTAEPSGRRSGKDRRATERRDSTDRRGAPKRPDAAAPGAPNGATAKAPTAATGDARGAVSGDDAVLSASAAHGSASQSEPAETETTEVSSRSTPDLLVLDGEPLPPIPASTHWIHRRDVQAGFAIGPLALWFLAWRRARMRRRRMRGGDAEESARRRWTSRNLPRR
jgi:signal peptidase I